MYSMLIKSQHIIKHFISHKKYNYYFVLQDISEPTSSNLNHYVI